MGLKIVSGSAKGRKLKGPKKKGIRPAAARVRKSIFDILGNLKGKSVLDLFAGTGSMGIEALSRGAESVTFVDSNTQAISLLFHNLKQTGFLEKSHILKRTAEKTIEWLNKKGETFDLIFLDPPYDEGHIQTCMKKLNHFDLLNSNGLLLCEHSPRELPTFLGGLEKVDERKYGQTLVSFFKKTKEKI